MIIQHRCYNNAIIMYCFSKLLLKIKLRINSKHFQMGNLVSNRISPNINGKKQSRLRSNPHIEVSRRNFRFIEKICTTGHNNESITYLAQNWDDPSQRFFIKKTSKQLASRHGRIQSIKNQLSILTKQGKNKFMIQPLFAFQDYSSLYLVNSYFQGFTLDQVLLHHTLSEDEAKYIILGLVNIIQRLHQQKFAFTELCPRNIIIDKKTGDMKLFELVNPLPIDSYYPSSMITPLNCYAAPQILLMDRVLAQSDYYSLGLIMHYIMKNKPAFPAEIINNRMAIINQPIQVAKSDLPEGWMPEAADFLVKLLIKNPELRLGRYGSFEVKNHPWLQNYIISQNSTILNINLNEDYFQQTKYIKIVPGASPKNPPREQINQSYQFQIQFENYSYRITQFEDETLSYDSIREQY